MKLNKTMGYLKGAILLGTLSLSFAMINQSAAAERRETMVSSFEGEVAIRRGETVAWQKAEKGLTIKPGDVVRTGAQSWVILRHNSAKIQLFENTLLEFPREQSSQQVREDGNALVTLMLQKGHSIFKVFKNRLKRRFEVISPSLMAGVKGTVFEVFEKESFKGVAVSEGIVEVTNLNFRDEVIEVTANQYTEIRDSHLMPPREHSGEDLLRGENHAPLKPGEVQALTSGAIEGKVTIAEREEFLKDNPEWKSDEDREDLSSTREDLREDLREERKTLAADLRDERKELAATIQDEVQTTTAEIRDDTKTATAEIRDDTKTAAAEIRDDAKTAAAEIRDDAKTAAAEIRDDAEATTAEIRDDTEAATLDPVNTLTGLLN